MVPSERVNACSSARANSSSRISACRGHQTVHHNIFLCETVFKCHTADFINNFNFFLQALRQSFVGKRKENKHGSILFCQREKLFELFRFPGNGVNQRPSGISSKSRLNHIHMTGIDGKGNVGGYRDLIQRFQHHFFLVNAAHSHIDIQKRRAVFFLLFRKGQNHIKPAFPQLVLEPFFACGINALPYNHKWGIQSESNRFALAGKIAHSLSAL